MITNLVEVLISTVLATNVSIRPETRSVPAPCPEGRPGCAVYHSKEEPVENPRWRTVETKIVEIRRHSVPSIGKTWDEEKVLSRDIRFEFRSETWTEDLERSAKLRDGGVLLSIYGSGLPMIVPAMRASSNIIWALGGTNAVATNAIISKLWLYGTTNAAALISTNWGAPGATTARALSALNLTGSPIGGPSMTNTLGLSAIFWPGAEVETVYDVRGRFRAVGTNMNAGTIVTRWRYEVSE